MNNAFNIFHQYVAAILAPSLRTFHVPETGRVSQFKNPGFRENLGDVLKNTCRRLEIG